MASTPNEAPDHRRKWDLEEYENLAVGVRLWYVKRLLEGDPFGIAEFARAVSPRNPLDGFSFAVHTGLVDLRTPPTCPCGRQKTLSIRRDREGTESQGLLWVCEDLLGQPRCTAKTSITSGTFFHDVHLPWVRVLELMLHWFFQTPVTSAAGQTGVSKETAVYWYEACREVCFDVEAAQDICIGGEGLHVEIDESHLFKRKYHRGRMLAHERAFWVFGGICRETKEAFIELVNDRQGPTLWPIIRRRIAAGTIILTDSARVYDNLAAKRLEEEEGTQKDQDGDGKGGDETKEEVPKRKPLMARDYKVDLQSAVGKSIIVAKNTPMYKSGGFYCSVCYCIVKDSLNFLDHINGKKHQRYLDMSMTTERSTLEQVRQRFETNKKKLAEKKQQYNIEKHMDEHCEEEKRMKEYRKQCRLKRKRKAKFLGSECDSVPTEDDGTVDMLTVMGFAAFGAPKK